MASTKKLTLGILGIAALSLAACGTGDDQAGAGFAPPPTVIETATVKTRAVTDLFEAVGTLAAGESVTVVSEIDGVVTSLPFREGSQVRRGALLAQLDNSQLSAERERAVALLAQSQSSYDRIKEVVDLGAGAPQDLDDAHAYTNRNQTGVSPHSQPTH